MPAFKSFFQQPARLQLAAALVLCLAVFVWLQPVNSFPDPDSWYHTKLTTLMRDGGLVTDFPWTQASLYREIFIDHHFLYHILALLFISFSTSDLAGLQIATIIFASLSVFILAWLLWRWRVPYWGVGLVLALTSAPFLFRLSLGKAPSLAIGVALVAWYLITQRKLIWLFILTWFYVWFYSAWPLLMVMTAIFILADSLNRISGGPKPWLQELFSRKNFKLIATVVSGIVLAIIFNPYWPVNLEYLKQIFGMALTPYYKFVNIGNEWYPASAYDLPQYISYPLLFWLVATLAGIFTWRRQSSLSRASWLMVILFFVYTLRARRQTEYLIPWMILSAGLMARDSGLGNYTWAILKEKFSSWLPEWLKSRLVTALLIVYGLIVVPWGLVKGPLMIKDSLAEGFGFNTMAGAAQWLKKNTAPRTIVFQNDWGTFPMLFYHNTQNYYLTGLDQTFMYEYDKEKYRQWQRIVSGETPRLRVLAKEMFGASYLVVDKRNLAIMFWLNRDAGIVKEYEDSEVMVYKFN